MNRCPAAFGWRWSDPTISGAMAASETKLAPYCRAFASVTTSMSVRASAKEFTP